MHDIWGVINAHIIIIIIIISLSFGRPYVMQSSEAWLPCSPLYYGLGSPSLQDYGLGQPAFLNRALLVISYCYRQDISLRQIHLRVV